MKENKLVNGCVLFIGGVLLGMAVSKLSARAFYDLGFNTAMNNQEKTCVAWWFNNSAQRIRQAQAYACGRQ